MLSHFSANIFERLKKVQWKTTKILKDTGHVKYEKRENKRLRGSQRVACSYFKSSYKDDKAELFWAVADDIKKTIATTWKLTTMRPFFRRVIQSWNSFPWGFWDSLGKALDDLSCWWYRRLTSTSPRGPFQHFCDSMWYRKISCPEHCHRS